jgi:hypothetical protein
MLALQGSSMLEEGDSAGALDVAAGKLLGL